MTVPLEEAFDAMAWATPNYPKKRVTNAGKILAAGTEKIDNLPAWQEYLDALDIVNNWRAAHAFPLNTIQIGLRRIAKSVESSAIVAQRIKRLSSITSKLYRFPTMSLSQMQDLGGCRAIVGDVKSVDGILYLYKKSNMKHHLHTLDNYIDKPKTSGYRGVHMIYTYNSDKNETYNGLKIEIQVRTQLQHAWATAVETVGTFVRQALKSSQGEKEWLRFFSLMGTALAIRENTPTIPGTPQDEASLIAELNSLAESLDVANKLRAYGAALKTLEDASVKSAHYFLMTLEPEAETVSVKGFKGNELQKATDMYLEVEKTLNAKRGAEAVLVSVESIAALQRAYPNYFLDTDLFLDALHAALRN